MRIFIDNGSGKPIYEQIREQIVRQIFTGALREDRPLPSIRSLAKDLRISVITVKRAYEELERDGYLYTVAGKGCYVAPQNRENIRAEYRERVRTLLRTVRDLAREGNLSDEEVQALCRSVLSESSE